MGTGRGAATVFLLVATVSSVRAGQSPHDTYNTLNALRPDQAAVYSITPENRIELRRCDLKLSFDEGRLAFFAPFEGRVTGLVFAGRGHALAMPRDPVEKQQMGRFLGAPVLDQGFTTAYLRFTDDTPAELLAQFKPANLTAATDAAFASGWDALALSYNRSHSLRMLLDRLAADPKPYFYAALGGSSVGPFDFLFDLDRA